MLRRSAALVGIFCWLLSQGCEKAPPAPSPTPGAKPAANAAKPVTHQSPAAQPASPSGQPATPTPPSAPNPSAAAPGPRWVCDPSVIDFGEVWAGETVQRSFTFRNTGTEVLRIEEPKAQCSCSSADNWTREVPPGGTGVIPFVLKTVNKPHGPLNEYLTIETNDPTNRTTNLWLKGFCKDVCEVTVVYDAIHERDAAAGKPVMPVEKTKGSFGKITANDRLHRILKLRRTNPEPLALTMQPLPANARFQVQFRETIPGDEYELTIIGEPPFAVGEWNMPIQFTTNIPKRPAYLLYVYAQVPPRLEAIPQKIVYEPKKYAGRERPIKILNHGTTPVQILTAATSEPRYQITRLPPNPAAPEEIGVNVSIPAEGYVVPPYGEMIELTTNDPELPVIRVPVLPTLGPATPRPADRPLQLYPVPL